MTAALSSTGTSERLSKTQPLARPEDRQLAAWAVDRLAAHLLTEPRPSSTTDSKPKTLALNDTSSHQTPKLERESERPAAILPSTPPRQETLQEWEGRVVKIGTEEFTARLVDLTAGQTLETEEADFLIVDLSDGDRALLRENAIFRWLIGYRYIGATKERGAVAEVVEIQGGVVSG